MRPFPDNDLSKNIFLPSADNAEARCRASALDMPSGGGANTVSDNKNQTTCEFSH
jgi:hypothetical protein